MSKPDAYQACGKARIECEKPRHKKTRHKAGFLVFLVAGARYENYMQIKIEPFPLVA